MTCSNPRPHHAAASPILKQGEKAQVPRRVGLGTGHRGIRRDGRREVVARAQELIYTVFKPRHVRTAPEEPGWNDLADIVGRWQRGFFYFVSVCASSKPDASSPAHEVPFTRLRHVASGTFDLAYMRHAVQWRELYHKLTLDDALQAIRSQIHF